MILAISFSIVLQKNNLRHAVSSMYMSSPYKVSYLTKTLQSQTERTQIINIILCSSGYRMSAPNILTRSHFTPEYSNIPVLHRWHLESSGGNGQKSEKDNLKEKQQKHISDFGCLFNSKDLSFILVLCNLRYVLLVQLEHLLGQQ